VSPYLIQIRCLDKLTEIRMILTDIDIKLIRQISVLSLEISEELEPYIIIEEIPRDVRLN